MSAPSANLDPTTPGGVASALDVRDRAWWIDWTAKTLVFGGGISAIVFIGAIFVFLGTQGLDFAFHRLDWAEFFGSIAWRPNGHPSQYGALALIVGTATITGLAMLVAVPFSLGAAVYIGEFAKGRAREWLKILIELLAAIPSVVWGVIGLQVMKLIIQEVFGVQVGLNVLNAGIILGLMAAPIMTTIAEDALKAVPDTYREAAEALGASRWQVIWRVVLPHARPGLAAAVLLGIGRAFGETIAVLMASGHRLMVPQSIFDSAATITATIAAELGEAAHGGEHYQVLFVLGLLLFAITFLINVAANWIVRGRRSRA